jgi:CPA1 family monovalent cation:H+ antiporter
LILAVSRNNVLFSAVRNYFEIKKQPIELEKFDTFWEVSDNLFNSLLYVILGLSFVEILRTPHVLVLSLVAIVINLISRGGSLAITSLFTGPLPDGYNRPRFVALLTWGGLRGGLSVALAMSTQGMVDDNTYHIILGGTFALVFFTTIVQGLTMPKVYNKIKV